MLRIIPTIWVIAVFPVVCFFAAGTASAAAPAVPSQGLSAEQQAFLAGLNAARVQHGLQALVIREPGDTLPVRIHTRVGSSKFSKARPESQYFLYEPGKGPLEDPFIGGTTDLRGQAVIGVPLFAFDLKNPERPKLLARANQDGFLLHYGRTGKLEPHRSVPLTVHLSLVEGATAVGRLYGMEGEGLDCRGAIRLFPETTDEGPPLPIPHSLQCMPDGWFLVHLTDPSRFALDVVKPGMGTTFLRGFEMSPSELPKDWRVELEQGGVLAGEVLNSKGQPLVGVHLVATFAGNMVDPKTAREVQAQSDGDGLSLPHQFELDAQGARDVSFETDAQGHFEQRGVRSGLYRIRIPKPDPFQHKSPWPPASPSWGPGEPGWFRAPRPIPADGKTHLLTFDRQTLSVDLLQTDGEPWLGSIRTTPLMVVPDAKPSYPKADKLWIQAYGPGRNGAENRDQTLTPMHQAPDPIHWQLEVAKPYLLVHVGPKSAPSVQRIDLPQDGSPQRATISMPDATPMGAVSVEVRIDPSVQDKSFLWRLEDAKYGIVLMRGIEEYGIQDWHTTLPPGSYRLVAEGAIARKSLHPIFEEAIHDAAKSKDLESSDFLSAKDLLMQNSPPPDDSTPSKSRVLGRAEVVFEIKGGVMEEVALDLNPSGYLRLELPPATTDLQPDGDLRLELWQDGRKIETLVHSKWESWTSEVFSTSWPFDSDHVSRMVAVGEFDLYAFAQGKQLAQRKVRVLQGEITNVTLFWPEPSTEAGTK